MRKGRHQSWERERRPGNSLGIRVIRLPGDFLCVE
jgi:hypothetical protein